MQYLDTWQRFAMIEREVSTGSERKGLRVRESNARDRTVNRQWKAVLQRAIPKGTEHVMLRDEMFVDASKTNSSKETCGAASELFVVKGVRLYWDEIEKSFVVVKYGWEQCKHDQPNQTSVVHILRGFRSIVQSSAIAVFEILHDINANKICHYRPLKTRI